MALEITLDIEQQRLTKTALVVEGDGLRWDEPSALRAVVTADGMAFVQPYQMTADWDTTTSSPSYRRWGRSDYRKADGTTTLSSSQWIENHRGLSGNIYLESMGVDETIYSLTSWPINRGMWLDFYVSEGAGDKNILIDCGWGETDTNGSVMVRVWGNGKIDILKRASGAWGLVGTYAPSRKGQRGPKKRKTGGLVSMVLLPCARRDLWIATSEWGELRHTFADLSPDAVGTITPSGRFWWHWRQQKASVACSELRFPTSAASLWSQVDVLREAPPALTTWYGTLYRDKPTASDTATAVVCQLMDGDSPGMVFSADGTKTRVRALVQMTASSQYTPFVYGVYLRNAPSTDSTSAEDTDITDNVLGFSLSVPDSPDGVSGRLPLKHEDASPADWAWQSDRALKISASDADEVQQPLLWGITEAPTLTEAQREVAGGHRPLTMPFSDAWSLIAEVIFEEDGYPYDGWLVHEAVGDLLTLAGWPTASGWRDLTTTTARLDYTIPLVDPDQDRGAPWAWKPQAGDTVGEWLKKILDTMAPTWFMGILPGPSNPIFYFLSPADLGTTPVADIFLHRGTAHPEGRIPCYGFQETTHPAEATAISIWGYNPAQRTLLRARWADSTLADPSLAPADRPPGWRGRGAPFAAILPRLTTAQSVGLARDQLAARIGSEQRLATWQCKLLFKSDGVPVWRGDCINIWPGEGGLAAGDAEGGVYRIRSLDINWRRDAFGDAGKREVGYVGERVDDLSGDPPVVVPE